MNTNVFFAEVIKLLTKIAKSSASGSGVSTAEFNALKTKVDGVETKANTANNNATTALNNANTALNKANAVEPRVTKLEAKTNFRIINETAATKTISPNIYYKWGETAALTITLGDNPNVDIVAEYVFEFISGGTATKLVLPSTLKYETPLVIEPNKIYQINIVNNIVAVINVDKV